MSLNLKKHSLSGFMVLIIGVMGSAQADDTQLSARDMEKGAALTLAGLSAAVASDLVRDSDEAKKISRDLTEDVLSASGEKTKVIKFNLNESYDPKAVYKQLQREINGRHAALNVEYLRKDLDRAFIVEEDLTNKAVQARDGMKRYERLSRQVADDPSRQTHFRKMADAEAQRFEKYIQQLKDLDADKMASVASRHQINFLVRGGPNGDKESISALFHNMYVDNERPVRITVVTDDRPARLIELVDNKWRQKLVPGAAALGLAITAADLSMEDPVIGLGAAARRVGEWIGISRSDQLSVGATQ